ncbi:hypothetical protein JXA40_03885 [bacterium]|nr:hypothetical protein [candidate division CSSED10-310 bacterium]
MNKFHHVFTLFIAWTFLVLQAAYASPVRISLPDDSDRTIRIIDAESSTDDAVTIRIESDNFDTLRMGENLTVPKGTVRKGDVVIFGGNGEVHGTVRGDVVVFGGGVNISGTVTGDVVVFGGTVSLAGTARIEGSLVAMGGTIEQEEGSAVMGDIVDMSGIPLIANLSRWFTGKLDIPRMDDTPVPRAPGRFLGVIGKLHLIILCFWFLITCALVFLGARYMEQAGETMRREPFRSLVAGFLFHAGFLVLFLGLIVTVIGIPVAVILVFFWLIVCIFSVPAGSYLLGKRTWELFNRPNASIFGSALTGLIILGLARFLPFFLGFLIWHLWFMAAVGATILSKFGSMRPWFRSRAAGYDHPPEIAAPKPPGESTGESPPRQPDNPDQP